MRFVNTKRFSPVIHGGDLPHRDDYFHERADLCTKEYLESKEAEKYSVDEDWWVIQEERCRKGFDVEEAVEPGGDMMVDGVDVFWSNDERDCYIPRYDLWIRDRKVHISGRHYFYLNFWKILAATDDKDDIDAESDTSPKDVLPPRFLMMDFFFFRRIQMMFEQGKNGQELKARQLGYSEKIGGGIIGWNFTFWRSSTNVIVAGEADDAKNTFEFCIRGLDQLQNTQFYKERAKTDMGKMYTTARRFGSRIKGLTAKSKPQAVSRLSPTVVVHEEIGKGRRRWSLKVSKFVKPSIITTGKRTGWELYIGCVCAGTKVWTNNGELKNIEDLKSKDGIIGYNEEDISKETITYMAKPFKKECYRITTGSGITLECSHDHPILWGKHNYEYVKRKQLSNGKRKIITTYKKTKFKRVEDIRVGEQIAFVDEIPLFGKNKMWEPRLVGMLIGDGSYGFDKTPVFSNCDYELNNYIYDRYDCVLEKSYITKDHREYKETRIRGICSKLRSLGIYGQTKTKKRLPLDLHYYDKNSLAKLIAGLFDTDGCVYIAKKGKKNHRIFITQLSKDLIYDLKYLLLRFGINSNIIVRSGRNRNRTIKDNSTYYELTIAKKDSIIKFHENIKLLVRSKKENLNYIINNLSSGQDARYWVKVSKNKDNKRFVDLKQLSRIIFDRVEKIEKIGLKNVYNLTANNTHTYLANGIITHNTGGDMDEGGFDLETRHYKPHSHDMLEFDNVFEREEERGDTKVGHFTGKDWFHLIDEDGNPLKEKSRKDIERMIQEADPDERHIERSQMAIYASDALMRSTVGFFGEEIITALLRRKSYILTHREEQIVRRGRLEPKDRGNPFKGVEFVPDEDNWWIQIIEKPELDVDGKPFSALYEGGTDSYDQDEANTSSSKGAMFVKKKFRKDSESSIYLTNVAMIVERPKTSEGGAKVFYFHTVLACIYYGCQNNIEYANLRIFDYYIDNGFESLLKERPRLAFAGLINRTQVSNRYGTDKSLKPHILAIKKDSLTEDAINRMYFVEELEALAKFIYDPSGKKYNCDITIASSEVEVAVKESEFVVVKSREKKLSEKKGVVRFQRVNGQLVRSMI